MKKLIYNKTIPIPSTYRNYLYTIRAWDDNTFELKKLGYGASPGWVATATVIMDPPALEWDNYPSEEVYTGSGETVVHQFEKAFLNWLANWNDLMAQETLETDSEWSLL